MGEESRKALGEAAAAVMGRFIRVRGQRERRRRHLRINCSLGGGVVQSGQSDAAIAAAFVVVARARTGKAWWL